MQILGDTPNLSNFYLLNTVQHLEISVNFLFEFELIADSFGLRRGIDDSEVVSAIVLDISLHIPLSYYHQRYNNCVTIIDISLHIPLSYYHQRYDNCVTMIDILHIPLSYYHQRYNNCVTIIDISLHKPLSY